MVKTLQKKSNDTVSNKERQIKDDTCIHRNMKGSKEKQRTYVKKSYEQVREEKKTMGLHNQVRKTE